VSLLAVATLAAAIGSLAAVPTVPADRCVDPAEDGPSPDLYCMELVAAPGLDGVAGHVQLDFVPGPFTISVTREGRQIYRPQLTVTGLPPVQDIDSTARAYVAWVTTPVFSPMINLGEVANGTVTLPPVSFDQFVIIVSAERSASVTERRGRLVLRGGSPSTRLQPPDFQQFSLAVMGSALDSTMMHGHSQHVPATSDSLAWTTVPMPAGIGMLPSEMALRPGATPFLPQARGRLPWSQRSQFTPLANGDTLTLRAGLVRRRIHGREYVMYAFNGQTPGPLLQVERGAVVTVRFINELDQPSTVHWHGLRLDWRMDGVPHISQEPVAPGASHYYTLRFPDAGVYWYHPHVREDIQQDLGLSGNIRVNDPASAIPEKLLLLDDLLIGSDGLVPFGRDHATHALMGRFGNVMLVNGEPAWTGQARSGATMRYWFTNASNTRTFNLSFTNARMRLVATDLSRFERQQDVESIVIAPAERYAIDVTFTGGRSHLMNRVRALDHVFGRFIQQDDTLGSVTVAGVRNNAARISADVAVVADTAFTVELASNPDLTLAFGLRVDGLPFITSRMMLLDSSYFHPVEWSGTMVGMNWATTTAQAKWFVRDVATGRENETIDFRVRQGDRKRIRLVNLRNTLHGMHHPIHLHGQRFLILSVNGVAPSVRAWKDTILLPAGSAADILVEFDNPGRWMLHCHIAEHVESGMMTTFEVEKP